MSRQPTVDMIQSVQIAFDFFNERLFSNSLDVPIFTFDYRKEISLRLLPATYLGERRGYITG